MIRVVLWGTPAIAAVCLEALVAAEGVEVVAVVTNPDRPGGRGHRLRASPVKEAGLAAGLAVWQPERPREVLADLEALGVDACAVVAYGSLLPVHVLAAGGAGFVNLHFSLLPAWRGAAPVQHTLLAGDRRTGVTCFVLDEGMDSGPVLATAETDVRPRETAGELLDRLAVLGAPVLVDALRGLVDGTLVATPQDHAQATLATKVGPKDAWLDWTAPAPVLDRVVRAYNPVPGAHTTLRGDRLKVHRASPVDGDGAPGEVLAAGGPVVACGQGALRLEEVQPAGKPRMAGEDFANGYRLAGALLGT